MPTHPLPLRFLTAPSVAGLALLAAPYSSAQDDADVPPSTATATIQGADDAEPVDLSGELLELKDGELLVSLWKGVDGDEAMREASQGDRNLRSPAGGGGGGTATPGGVDESIGGGQPAGAGTRRSSNPSGRDGEGADGAPAPKTGRLKVSQDVVVYLNGRKAALSDLQPGDRVRVRGTDRDDEGVHRIVALRTGENRDEDPATRRMRERDDADMADTENRSPASADPTSTDAPTPEIARAAETGITTPGGGGFQNSPRITPRGESKKNLDDPRRGVAAGAAASPGYDAAPGTVAPGFGFAAVDSPGEGVLILDLQPDGPAATAGVLQGDYLLRLDDESVGDLESVKRIAARELESGEPSAVSAVLWRDGAEETVQIAPSGSAMDHYESSTRQALLMPGRAGDSPRIGVGVRNVDGTGVEVLGGAGLGRSGGGNSGGGNADASSSGGTAGGSSGARNLPNGTGANANGGVGGGGDQPGAGPRGPSSGNDTGATGGNDTGTTPGNDTGATGGNAGAIGGGSAVALSAGPSGGGPGGSVGPSYGNDGIAVPGISGGSPNPAAGPTGTVGGAGSGGGGPTGGGMTGGAGSAGAPGMAAGAMSGAGGTAGGGTAGGSGFGGSGLGGTLGYYGSRAMNGLNIYDFAGAGGGQVYSAPTPAQMLAKQRMMAAAATKAAADRSLGVDDEDQYVGQRPPQIGGESPRDSGDGEQPDRLLPYDRIIGVNNRPVHDRVELNRALESFRGETLTLNVIRNGERVNLKLSRAQPDERGEN